MSKLKAKSGTPDDAVLSVTWSPPPGYYQIFYPKGITFMGDAQNRQNAPKRGVQVIVQFHPDVISEIVTGADFYVWWHNRWQGLTHKYDLWDFAIENGFLDKNDSPSAIDDIFDELIEDGHILLGRMISQDEYNAIIQEANLVKTGWLPNERKTTDR